jgi:hypothetical protein
MTKRRNPNTLNDVRNFIGKTRKKTISLKDTDFTQGRPHATFIKFPVRDAKLMTVLIADPCLFLNLREF